MHARAAMIRRFWLCIDISVGRRIAICMRTHVGMCISMCMHVYRHLYRFIEASVDACGDTYTDTYIGTTCV